MKFQIAYILIEITGFRAQQLPDQIGIRVWNDIKYRLNNNRISRVNYPFKICLLGQGCEFVFFCFVCFIPFFFIIDTSIYSVQK